MGVPLPGNVRTGAPCRNQVTQASAQEGRASGAQARNWQEAWTSGLHRRSRPRAGGPGASGPGVGSFNVGKRLDGAVRASESAARALALRRSVATLAAWTTRVFVTARTD